MNNYFVWVDMGANRKLITDPALFAEILDKYGSGKRWLAELRNDSGFLRAILTGCR